jgi:hypothetical protein
LRKEPIAGTTIEQGRILNMRKTNLQGRLDLLKAKPGLRDMTDFFGKTYDALRQMDLCTGTKSEDKTQEAWEREFVEREGTRADFITKKTNQWNRQHSKRRK